jgi:hypothetical protein
MSLKIDRPTPRLKISDRRPMPPVGPADVR